MPTSSVALDVPSQGGLRRLASVERIIEGQRVIAERPVLSNLPIPEGRDPADFAIRGFTELELEDGSLRYSCADCEFFGTRGSVMKHRARNHRTQTSRRQRREEQETPAAPALPSDLRSMSLGDVLEMGQQLNTLSVVIENLTAQRDEYRERCTELEQRLRKIDQALTRAGYVAQED